MDKSASHACSQARLLLAVPLLLGLCQAPPAYGASFVRGDANADGRINITDGIFVLNFLFLGGTTPRCLDAADADDKSKRALNITDAIFLLDFLFLGGSSPPPPGSGSATYGPGDCGEDPTPDSLGCETFDPCPQEPSEPVFVVTTSPGDGDEGVAVSQETVIDLSGPVDPATVNGESFKVSAAREPVETRIHLSPSRDAVTLFYPSYLPPAARVTVSVHGSKLKDSRGRPVDADGDGEPGGIGAIQFDTLGLATLGGTSVCGRVFASELAAAPGGDTINVPLEGVTITMDGLERTHFAITDQFGDFRLEPVPPGRFFVHIRGYTATNPVPGGAYYPSVGKAWESVAGEETNIGEVYLPVIPRGTLQDTSASEDTTITFTDEVLAEHPELAGVFINVPADSLYSEDGTRGGRIGIAPVPPDRIPSPLPEGLDFPLVITVQTDGASNFDAPVPVCFPNLPDPVTQEKLPAGAPSALWSFSHDSGRWEVVGPMTVSADGTLVCTDPGVGILSPGWHGSQPGVGFEADEAFVGGDCITDVECPTCNLPRAAPTNDPCKGKGSGGEPGSRLADPIYFFSGEVYEDVEDLRIKGRGLDFIWGRKYRSKIGPNTRQGNGWDSSYNVSIQLEGPDILVLDGNTRADLFVKRPDGTWGREELFRVIEKKPDGSHVLVFEDQGTWTFFPFDGTPRAGKLSRSVDRNGNSMTFQYDPQGRLSLVTDTLGRDIRIAYDAGGMIASVTDFAGRAVRYTYYNGVEPGGSKGDLKSATTPAVTGTPNGNDFPQGKTTTYTYSTGFADDRLNHNLLTITDGRRNDPGDPTFGDGPYVVNIYSDATDPTDLNHDRVVRQIWGGDAVDMVYARLESSSANGGAVTKTIIRDRGGNVKEYFYDDHNRAVRIREYTGRSLTDEPVTETTNRPVDRLRPSDPEYFETIFEYTQDSLQRRVIHPNGNITEYVYESDLNPAAPPRSRGNLRIERHQPGSHMPAGDQAVIENRFEYDTDFQSGCCGFNFVTRETDGRGKESLYQYDSRGNRTRVVHRIPSIVEDYEYNEFGQLVKMIHPSNGSGSRRVDVFTQYTRVESDDQEGYLKAAVVDAENLQLTTTFEYDKVGNVVRVIDPRGHDTRFVLNALDQVVREISREVTDGSGVRYQTDTFYDANDNVVRVDVQNVNDRGLLEANTHFTTTFEYEVLNHLVRKAAEVDASRSIVTEHDYDSNRNLTVVRAGEATSGRLPANTIRMEYDERDLLYRRTRAQGDPDQSTDQVDYDRNGNAVRIHSGLEGTPQVSTIVFDGYDRAVSSTDPMGNVTLLGYDANHNQLEIESLGELRDVPGSARNVSLQRAVMFYDAQSRLVRTEAQFFDPATGAALGDGLSTSEVAYSDDSQVVSVVDDQGRRGTLIYDSANRLDTSTDPAGNVMTHEYDENSNLISVTEREKSDLGRPEEVFVSQVFYDNLDRLVRTINNDGDTFDFAYDSRGNRTLELDALRATQAGPGNATRHEYDGLSRLLKTTRFLTSNGTGAGAAAGSIVTAMAYDDSSRIVSRGDGNGNLTRYAYDALNRSIRVTQADGTARTARYDVHDNVVESADANGSTLRFTHDLLDRLVETLIMPGAGVSNRTTFERFEHDGLSRMVKGEDDDSVVTARYDSLSNLVQETLNGEPTRSTHDALGNVISTTYPGGRAVTHELDVLDRPRSISDQAALIASYAYIGTGRVERRDYANGTRGEYEYDAARRVTRTTHRKLAPATLLDDRRVTWDRMGSKTSRRDLLPGGATHDYSYDSIYRLVRSEKAPAAGGPIPISYALDNAGNRQSVAGGPGAGAYLLANALPEPADLQVNQYSGTPRDTRQHDKNGNLTRINPGQPGERRLAYDFRNQLVEHLSADGTRSAYSYDVLGRRIKKVVDDGTPETTLFFYDGWRVIEEQSASGATLATYVYGNYIDEVLTMARGGLEYFYHGDDQHNVMKVTGANGDVAEGYEYGDYGEPTFLNASNIAMGASAIGNPFLFNGQRFDPETGFYYYRTRYLDPETGRFLSRDVIGMHGDPENLGNGYTYAGNNPWSRVDPLGLKDEGLWAAASFAGGLLAGGAEGLASPVKALQDLAGAVWDKGFGVVKDMYKGFKGLLNNLLNGEFGEVAKAVVPELYELVTKWNCLSWYERGRLIGKVVGEWGAQVLLGTASVKILGKLRQARAAAAAKPRVPGRDAFHPGGQATRQGLRFTAAQAQARAAKLADTTAQLLGHDLKTTVKNVVYEPSLGGNLAEFDRATRTIRVSAELLTDPDLTRQVRIMAHEIGHSKLNAKYGVNRNIPAHLEEAAVEQYARMALQRSGCRISKNARIESLIYEMKWDIAGGRF